jgi:hypothetical protein
MNLSQTYQTFLAKKYPNAEAVSQKMFQLFDYAIKWEEPAAENVVGRIIASEESLLNRTFAEIKVDGSVLQPIRVAIGAASDEEWNTFLSDNHIPPLPKEDRHLVYQFESGILGKDFTDWVLNSPDEGKSPNKEIA